MAHINTVLNASPYQQPKQVHLQQLFEFNQFSSVTLWRSPPKLRTGDSKTPISKLSVSSWN